MHWGSQGCFGEFRSADPQDEWSQQLLGPDPRIPQPGSAGHEQLASWLALPKFLTESKLTLLTAQQANKSTVELFGQGVATVVGKPADPEDGGLASQRTSFPELEFRLLLY